MKEQRASQNKQQNEYEPYERVCPVVSVCVRSNERTEKKIVQLYSFSRYNESGNSHNILYFHSSTAAIRTFCDLSFFSHRLRAHLVKLKKKNKIHKVERWEWGMREREKDKNKSKWKIHFDLQRNAKKNNSKRSRVACVYRK